MPGIFSLGSFICWDGIFCLDFVEPHQNTITEMSLAFPRFLIVCLYVLEL